ncbi:alcohol dehydrogenase catalytic domain-containing protein [Bradyrhizobium sp. 183]|nr:alcohol dehydrogenase catalytic domain-containing protein [Bradyrhizobium sp. 184]UPJ92163.1 alcohol dehydrogenase catalytic domain-containing protein [Bradyrhizobium sp. 183]
MHAAVMTGVRDRLEVRDVPLPEIGAEDALVKVVASGICRSDWHLWNGGWRAWSMNLPEPAVLGHEMGGVIAAVGSAVTHVRVGQRVTVPFNIACGHCPYCHTGHQNLCDHMTFQQMTAGCGGWAEYARVPTADLNCITLPDEVDEFSAAALGCRYMTAWRAVRDRARLKAGETMVIFGCGGVGLAAVEICAALGAIPVAVDIDASKLTQARSVGAGYAISAKGRTKEEVANEVRNVLGGLGANAALDALGGSRTSLPAIMSLRKGGRLVQVGLTGNEDEGKVAFPADEIVNKELSIVGSLGNPHSSFPELLSLVASGRLKPSALVSRKVALTDVSDVLEEMDRFATSGYVIITSF